MPATLFPYFKALLVLYFILGMHMILATPGGIGLYLSFNTIGWIFTVLFIGLGFWQITLNKEVYYSKFQAWALFGFCLLCVPFLYENEFSELAIPRTLGLAGGLLFWFILSQFYFSNAKQHPRFNKHSHNLENIKQWLSKKVHSHILIYILYAVAIEASFGLIQVFILSHGDWSGYIPGTSRPHGVFLQPNVMASFMATGLAIALYLSVNLRYVTRKKLNTFLIYYVLLSTSFLLTLLLSRSGHLSACLVVILLGIYVFKQNKKQALRTLLTLLLGIIMGFACLVFNDSGNLKQRSSESYQNAGQRPNTYIVTSEMIMRNPIKGVGYGLYERAFVDTYNDVVKTRPELLPVQHRMAHPHNEVLFWVSEGGVVALLGLLCFALGYIAIWRKVPSPKSLAILGLITPLLLHSQLEFPFYTSLSHWLIFIIMLWIAEINSKSPYYVIPIYRTFLIRFVAITLTVLFIPFFATTLHTAHIMVKFQQQEKPDLASLQNIINPIGWQRQLDKYIYGYILYGGLTNKDPDALRYYIKWGLNRIQYKPSAIVYSNILLCYKLLNEQEKYDELYIEASTTYPLYKTWGTHLQTHDDKPISDI